MLFRLFQSQSTLKLSKCLFPCWIGDYEESVIDNNDTNIKTANKVQYYTSAIQKLFLCYDNWTYCPEWLIILWSLRLYSQTCLLGSKGHCNKWRLCDNCKGGQGQHVKGGSQIWGHSDWLVLWFGFSGSSTVPSQWGDFASLVLKVGENAPRTTWQLGYAV